VASPFVPWHPLDSDGLHPARTETCSWDCPGGQNDPHDLVLQLHKIWEEISSG